MIDIENHPCFNEDKSRETARIHLPVAPRCNVRCNFCNRKFDCVNESRPGVTSCVLSPGQSVAYLRDAVKATPNIAVVGIAGPGDPFANPDETLETLRRVRAEYPDMILCVATNGLNLAPCVSELAELQVSHVTITISAVDPEIGGHIYGWVRHNKKVYRGTDAGQIMLDQQMKAIDLLKEHGILLKVNTIVIPGINDQHIPTIARTMSEKGADILNCMDLCPVEGTPFEHVTPPSRQKMARIRLVAQQYIPQMAHCNKCRADAAGIIGEEMSEEMQCCLQRASERPLEPEEERPFVAIASREGVIVNQHLGEADSLWIFGSDEGGGYPLIGMRQAPAAGTGKRRWAELAEILSDCRTVLCSGAGGSPTETLRRNGIDIIMMNGIIHEALEAVYSGQEVRAPIRKHQCGSGCSGDGTGCG